MWAGGGDSTSHSMVKTIYGYTISGVVPSAAYLITGYGSSGGGGEFWDAKFLAAGTARACERATRMPREKL